MHKPITSFQRKIGSVHHMTDLLHNRMIFNSQDSKKDKSFYRTPKEAEEILIEMFRKLFLISGKDEEMREKHIAKIRKMEDVKEQGGYVLRFMEYMRDNNMFQETHTELMWDVYVHSFNYADFETTLEQHREHFMREI
jgi:hypothetical protein